MIIVHNDYIRVLGLEATRRGRTALEALRKETAYLVAGHEHTDKFQSGVWDGRIQLVRRSRRGKRGEPKPLLIPTGLLAVAQRHLKGYRFADKRRRPKGRMDFEWVGPDPRGYQGEAVRAILDRCRVRGLAPRGIIKVPIRGGKTLIAGRILAELGWSTLFVVESEMLLGQTARALRSYLHPRSFRDEWIGVCGSGEWDPRWVTVATVQTLLARPREARALEAKTDLLLIDEVHHMRADEWRKPIMRTDAFGKIGLSATLFEDPDIPQERSAIWVRACTGPIRYEVPIERLIQEGHLLQPTVLLYRMPLHGAPQRWRYGRTYSEFIANNEERNATIADLAEQAAKAGLLTLIDTGRLDQMRRLEEMLSARGVEVETLHGSTPPARRRRVVERFQKRKVAVVIGTILGEGVDIPELEVVINAEGGKSRIAVMQRLRNLTVSEGKTRAIVIDFADLGQRHMQEHSLARLDLYDETRGFRIRVIEGMTRPARIPDDLLPGSSGL